MKFVDDLNVADLKGSRLVLQLAVEAGDAAGAGVDSGAGWHGCEQNLIILLKGLKSFAKV
jgi:hypothetical protein